MRRGGVRGEVSGRQCRSNEITRGNSLFWTPKFGLMASSPPKFYTIPIFNPTVHIISIIHPELFVIRIGTLTIEICPIHYTYKETIAVSS